MSPHGARPVIGVLVLLWTTAQIHRFTVAAFIGASSIMGDFGVTAAGAGLLAAVYFPVYGLVQVPSGIVADVLRPKRVVLIAGGLFAASATLFALAPSLELAVLARTAVGFTAGFIWLPSLKILASLTDVSYRRAVSVLVSLGSLGTVGAMVGLPPLVAFMGWRTTTALLTLPILAACLLLFWVRTPEAAAPDPARPGASVRSSLEGLAVVLRDRGYWRIFLPGMLWNGGQFALLSWLPRYARDVVGLPPAAIGIVPALLPIGLVVGSYVVGWWQSRWPSVGMRPFYANFGIWTALLLLFALGAFDGLGAAGLVPLMLVMGLLYGAWFMGLARTGELAGPRLLGTATGVANGLGFFPAFVYPWLMGLAMDAVDRPPGPDWTYSAAAFRAGFLIVAAGSLLGLIGLALLRRPASDMRAVRNESP